MPTDPQGNWDRAFQTEFPFAGYVAPQVNWDDEPDHKEGCRCQKCR